MDHDQRHHPDSSDDEAQPPHDGSTTGYGEDEACIKR